jgi:hypothetical protein
MMDHPRAQSFEYKPFDAQSHPYLMKWPGTRRWDHSIYEDLESEIGLELEDGLIVYIRI